MDWKEQIREACELIRQGQFANATARLRQVAEEAEAPEARAAAFTNLGFAYAERGRYLEAEQSLWRAVKLYEVSGGERNPGLVVPLNSLAVLDIKRQRFKDARVLLKRAAFAAQYEESDDSFADVLINLGQVERAGKNLKAAEACYQRAFYILERHGGPHHRSTPAVLLNLGVLNLDRGNTSEAVRYMEKAVEIRQATLAGDHPDVGNALMNLGRAIAADGDLHGATSTLQKALHITENSLGPEHPRVAEVLREYAAVLRKSKQNREARKLRKRAQAIEARYEKENLLGHTVDWSELQALRQR